jgi:hypothetical protein
MSKVELSVGPNLYSSWPRALPNIKNCYNFILFYFFHFFMGKKLTNLRAFKKMDLSILFFKMPHPPNSGRKNKLANMFKYTKKSKQVFKVR